MTFVNALLSMLSKGFNFLGDMLARLIEFIAKPLSYVFYFFDGVFYFLFQLFNVVVKIIMIFVAMVQFFGAIVVGFVRTIMKMLSIDFNASPPNYPGGSYKGIQAVLDVFQPLGVLTVVPLIILAITWFLFVKQIIGLIGGGARSDA